MAMTTHYRPAKARINLEAIQHNLRLAKAHAGTANVLAVIKADAYGHGLEAVAKFLQQDTDEFGVASIDDVIRLRNIGIQHAITCLSGFYHQDELSLFVQHNATAVVYDESQLENLRTFPNEKGTLKVWLKIDTGMGRLGFHITDVERIVAELYQLKGVELLGILTHFANSDVPEDNKNQQQLDLFINTIIQLKSAYSDLKFSTSNSAATLSRTDCMFDLIRPGIMLYGVSPIIDQTAEDLDLSPAMTFESELISVREVKKDSTVGYGCKWRAPNDIQVGVVAVGYGDGYPRHAPTGTPVLVNGQRTQLIGRVSMDLISIDLSQMNAKVGDKVTLWGEGLPIEEIAASAGTISYELLCGVTNRVQKIFDK